VCKTFKSLGFCCNTEEDIVVLLFQFKKCIIVLSLSLYAAMLSCLFVWSVIKLLFVQEFRSTV
jgi:hypothetical protein